MIPAIELQHISPLLQRSGAEFSQWHQREESTACIFSQCVVQSVRTMAHISSTSLRRQWRNGRLRPRHSFLESRILVFSPSREDVGREGWLLRVPCSSDIVEGRSEALQEESRNLPSHGVASFGVITTELRARPQEMVLGLYNRLPVRRAAVETAPRVHSATENRRHPVHSRVSAEPAKHNISNIIEAKVSPPQRPHAPR